MKRITPCSFSLIKMLPTAATDLLRAVLQPPQVESEALAPTEKSVIISRSNIKNNVEPAMLQALISDKITAKKINESPKMDDEGT